MSKNFKSTRPARLQWLLLHPEFWRDAVIEWSFADLEVNRPLKLLFKAMQDAGLYSEKSYAYDAHLDRLVEEARTLGTTTSKETRNVRRKS